MDYPNRKRIKIWGEAYENTDDNELIEYQTNIDVMWLLKMLSPHYKTIAVYNLTRSMSILSFLMH